MASRGPAVSKQQAPLLNKQTQEHTALLAYPETDLTSVLQVYNLVCDVKRNRQK